MNSALKFGTVTIAATTLALHNHYKGISSSTAQLPAKFRANLSPKSNCAYFSRLIHTKKPITIQSYVDALFTSKIYKLELLLSSSEYSPRSISLHDKIGNLKVIELDNDHAVFEYEHEGFDFKLYISVINKPGLALLNLGFIDDSGQKIQQFGHKVYSPMMLESASRLIEKNN